MAWTIFRILFGLFFIYAPLLIIVQFGGQQPPEPLLAARHFTEALNEAGFINPSLIAVYLVGGLAMLFERSAPVGLLLLGPPVFVIAGFHWFLTHKYMWGSLWPLWFAALAWHDRHVFARLWDKR